MVGGREEGAREILLRIFGCGMRDAGWLTFSRILAVAGFSYL